MQVLELDREVDQKPEGNMQTGLASLRVQCKARFMHMPDICTCSSLGLAHPNHFKAVTKKYE